MPASNINPPSVVIPPSTINEPKPLPDFLKETNPQSFGTMSGTAMNANDFNLNNFGTMQPGTKNAQVDFSMFEKKNPTTANTENTLI